MGNSTMFLKLKIELPYNPVILHLCKNPENSYSNRCMQANVLSSAIQNSQDMKATLMSIDRWMNKDVAYIHNGVLFSHKEE